MAGTPQPIAPANGAPTASPATPASSTPSFQLPPEVLKTYPGLTKFKDPVSLAKSYGEMEKHLGTSLRMPAADASQEERDAFYTKLGRPESADKYDIKFAEGTAVDDNLLGAFRGVAHKLGLTQTQAQALGEWWAGQAQGMGEAQGGQIKADLETWDKDLSNTWGWQKDHNMVLASRALRTVIGDDAELGAKVTELLDSTGLGNHPEMVKLFHKIALRIGEDKFITEPTGPSSDDRVTAKSQINEIRGDKEHPYNNPKHPSHKEAVARMKQLYEIMYAPEG